MRRRHASSNADFRASRFRVAREAIRVKVIGNLPFNAAAAIFRMLCDNSRSDFDDRADVSARGRRREFARRPATRYSALSACIAALYFDIDLHFASPPAASIRKPKVDAEVLAISAAGEVRLFEARRGTRRARNRARLVLRAAQNDSQLARHAARHHRQRCNRCARSSARISIRPRAPSRFRRARLR